jgi:hypothetical protein
MALFCPNCGQQILARRLGFCPSCLNTLPESMRLEGEARETIDDEYERAKRAAKGMYDGGGGDGGFGWGDGGCDGGGDCGGD